MTCPICHHREPDPGTTIDGVCRNRIDDDLHRIAELTRLAGDWLTTTSGNSGGNTRPVPASRPPLNIAALDAALGNDVLRVLEDWCRLTREEAHLSPYGAATANETVTVDSTVTWLRSWLPWACERPDYPIEDYAREVRDLRWQLEALDPDRDKPGTILECPGDHPDSDGRLCRYRLRLESGRDDDIHCPRCDTTWNRQRLVLVAKATEGGTRAWATAVELADHLKVGTATIGRWARAGHITKMRVRDGWVYDVRETLLTASNERTG